MSSSAAASRFACAHFGARGPVIRMLASFPSDGHGQRGMRRSSGRRWYHASIRCGRSCGMGDLRSPSGQQQDRILDQAHVTPHRVPPRLGRWPIRVMPWIDAAQDRVRSKTRTAADSFEGKHSPVTLKASVPAGHRPDWRRGHSGGGHLGGAFQAPWSSDARAKNPRDLEPPYGIEP
jgi:hypothetical protein